MDFDATTTITLMQSAIDRAIFHQDRSNDPSDADNITSVVLSDLAVELERLLVTIEEGVD